MSLWRRRRRQLWRRISTSALTVDGNIFDGRVELLLRSFVSRALWTWGGSVDRGDRAVVAHDQVCWMVMITLHGDLLVCQPACDAAT